MPINMWTSAIAGSANLKGDVPEIASWTAHTLEASTTEAHAATAVPMSLLADHPDVHFHYCRHGLGKVEAEMH